MPKGETTINNTYDFGIGKLLANLPKLREVGFAANRHLLRAERLSHDCMLAETTFQAIERPINRDGQRISGLRFADPKVHDLWHALLLFRLLADGFRNADLRQHLADLEGRSSQSIGRGSITYQLRRLRLHRMIERRPHSQRYRVRHSTVARHLERAERIVGSRIFHRRGSVLVASERAETLLKEARRISQEIRSLTQFAGSYGAAIRMRRGRQSG